MTNKSNLLLAMSLVATACSTRDPLWCESDADCTLVAGRTKCDLTGEHDADRIRKTCEAPWDLVDANPGDADAPLIDANPIDASLVDAPTFDAAPCKRRIAFMTSRTGDFEIYTMNEDGSNPTNFTSFGATDNYPQWSPDGNYLAWLSDRSGTTQLYVQAAQGGSALKVSTCGANVTDFSWAPSSGLLFYTCVVSSSEDDLYLTNTSGGAFNLTPSVGGHNQGAQLDNSGTVIAFQSDRDGDFEIYTMDLVGQNVKQLTMNTAKDVGATWSPNGAQITFVSDRAGPNPDLYLMSANGSGQTPIRTGLQRGAIWSPSGTKLAVTETDAGPVGNVYSMDPNGANAVNLSNSTANNVAQAPTWSPGSDRVAFYDRRTGTPHIFAADVDGANFKDLTTPSDGSNPSWQRVCH